MPQTKPTGIIKEQFIPLILTVVVFFLLAAALYTCIRLLNLVPNTSKISLQLRWMDILIGATVYIKTAVDFAIFMGRLMGSNPGWKNRIAIEIGTALGNSLGTILILVIWIFFKEVSWLLAIMILLASLVLFELAQSGLGHFASWDKASGYKKYLYRATNNFLNFVLKIIYPVTSKIIPDLDGKLSGNLKLPWGKLLLFAFTLPFILGLDDFAGYVPLFNIVNVFGFGVGVLAAHTLLNAALFIDPETTVRVVKNAWVSFLGTLAFIGLALWGLLEVIRIFVR